MSPLIASRADGLAWTVVGFAVALALALAAHRVWVSPGGRLIFEDDGAPWIMAVEPFSANLRQWGRSEAPVLRFQRDFALAGTPGAEGARLRWRSFGEAAIRLNGEPLPLPPAPDRWQRFRELEVGAWLRPGANRLEVDVRNARGPALLSLRLQSGSTVVTSDAAWQVARGAGPLGPVEPARDRRRHPDARRAPSPLQALAARWLPVTGLFALSAGLVLLGRERLARLPARRSGLLGAAVVCVAWLVLFARRLVAIPLELGFDARRHLEYVALLREQLRVPLATEGWSMYHPPLYHTCVAALLGLGEALGPGLGPLLAKLPAFAAGLCTAWLSWRLVLRLHPGEHALAWAALAFAAVLPMNVCLAAYVSNESLLAALSAAALLAAVDLLLAPGSTPGGLLRLSLWLGLALLTKYTAWILVAVVLPFVAAKLARERLAGPTRDLAGLARALALSVGPMLAIAGWFYLRNGLVYGRPLVPNWDLPGADQVWWSPPGFHTPAYYLHFGEALVHPYFSAFSSFWDALYSTLWGDGLAAGSAALRSANPHWSYGWMTAGYLLALPLCALLGVGAAELLRRVLRDPDPGRRAAQGLLLAFAGALGFGVFYATLSLPYFGQAKAFYALGATPVLALCFAHGWRVCDRALSAPSLHGLRAALSGVVATALAVLFLGFVG